MEIESAIRLIGNLIYKPGWVFEAKDYSNRFEGAIAIRIEYPAFQSERADAAKGYPNEIRPYATFPVVVDDCDDVSLYRLVLTHIMEIEEHEAREFLRVEPTMWAPFHPHRADGMRRFGAMQQDLRFGLA
ncbi:hypothetical protein [Spirillospora sp. CA-128828]|uniref:hypothetical protein n=1 Tax=Spirillospora sp. CA-128828 TaxID=3240033 RepID=UPI003D8B6D35